MSTATPPRTDAFGLPVAPQAEPLQVELITQVLPMSAEAWADDGGPVPVGHDDHVLLLRHSALWIRVAGCQDCGVSFEG